MDKEVQKIKRQLRKKYSADGASQLLTPTKNGREQSDGSKNSRQKSKKKSSGGTKLKSALKKGAEVSYPPTLPKPTIEKEDTTLQNQPNHQRPQEAPVAEDPEEEAEAEAPEGANVEREA